MNWQEFLDLMTNFRTDRIMQQLAAWNIGDLGQNQYVLAGFALAIAITYFLGWKAISGLIIGIGGFIYALSYAVAQGTGTAGLSGDGVWVLVGGGGASVVLFIYLLFIRSE
ncbi:hypothetical protein [Geopsychrobacter electrodiphilus]|uniref:hypothetical protein n=1 Tax=Geopsychrobacter electrodiphilus TaxID=225196 RepID=UPI000365BBAE|nr:hypothetical protein [Geopsychrobacter electrodiphilus]